MGGLNLSLILWEQKNKAALMRRLRFELSKIRHPQWTFSSAGSLGEDGLLGGFGGIL